MILFSLKFIPFAFYCRRCTSSANVRVRFAPSPTGFLHLGGLRTAFFNYLFARKHKGIFVLRIEDTDQKRVQLGSVDNLNTMLKWTGLCPDESPEVGGPYQPYVQSERLEMYKEKAETLLEAGAAYRCFCSETRLTVLRKAAIQNREVRGYDNRCRHLEASEVEQHLKEKRPFTIRFKIPQVSVSHEDLVYGNFTYNVSENEGDFVIMKSDGYPTYHFACVVDDHLMAISHVLRGSEWLVSTPKHILLHQALGWQPPTFAHLPLLTNSDRSKLSKRQESIGIEHFKNKGYSPDALLNFLAAAGGGFGKQEGCFVDSLETLCSKFKIEYVNKNSCIVDMRKLDLFNRDYLSRQLSSDILTAKLIFELRKLLKDKYGDRYSKEEKSLPDSYMKMILECYKDRMVSLSDLMDSEKEFLWTTTDTSAAFDMLSSFKLSTDVISSLKDVYNGLSNVHDLEFTQEKLGPSLEAISSNLDMKYSTLMRVIRIVLTAQKDGPPVSEVLAMLGKKRSLEKISAFVRSHNLVTDVQTSQN